MQASPDASQRRLGVPGYPLCLQVHEVLFINELQNQDRKLSLQRRLEVGWTAVHMGGVPS